MKANDLVNITIGDTNIDYCYVGDSLIWQREVPSIYNVYRFEPTEVNSVAGLNKYLNGKFVEFIPCNAFTYSNGNLSCKNTSKYDCYDLGVIPNKDYTKVTIDYININTYKGEHIITNALSSHNEQVRFFAFAGNYYYDVARKRLSSIPYTNIHDIVFGIENSSTMYYGTKEVEKLYTQSITIPTITLPFLISAGDYYDIGTFTIEVLK